MCAGMTLPAHFLLGPGFLEVCLQSLKRNYLCAVKHVTEQVTWEVHSPDIKTFIASKHIAIPTAVRPS